jgi:hypothetical protein
VLRTYRPLRLYADGTIEMKSGGTTRQVKQFEFLRSFWPDLHAPAVEAEQSAASLPTFAAVRLRGFAETMIAHLFRHMGLLLDAKDNLYNRLKILQVEGRIDAHILAKFHTIRKLGNVAAHNGSVSAEQAESLIEDAWSLAHWFCRHVRPDIVWPTADAGPIVTSSRSEDACDERIHADEVAAPYWHVSPPRTRISLREAFEAELTADQERCILGRVLN